jgi:hypothetical protein
VDRDALVAHWWEYQRLASGSGEERKALESGQPLAAAAAFEYVASLVDSGASEVVGLLAELIDEAPAGRSVATVGAGPLEDLIHDHGDSLVDEIDERARRSGRFAEALASVWLERDRLDPATVARLSVWVS